MKIGSHSEGTKQAKHLTMKAVGESSPSAKNDRILKVFYLHIIRGFFEKKFALYLYKPLFC
jgi:hypothetical protein